MASYSSGRRPARLAQPTITRRLNSRSGFVMTAAGAPLLIELEGPGKIGCGSHEAQKQNGTGFTANFCAWHEPSGIRSDGGSIHPGSSGRTVSGVTV